ncbi:Hypothetical protein UVM_LOCUS93 [uncultured virus]|nr:Hypothetical protein UVM_LOCUS93 [uncultured virus]
MDRIDRSLLLHVGVRLDWRSAQALSCTQRSFCAASRDETVRATTQHCSVEENWRDGRSVERGLPSEIVRAQRLHSACVGGVPVLAALLDWSLDWTDGRVALFDCRTLRRLAVLVDEEPIVHHRLSGSADQFIPTDMASDGRRALVMRVLRYNLIGDLDESCAVHLYDHATCSSESGDAPSLAPVCRIVRRAGAKRMIDVHATRDLDRVLVELLDQDTEECMPTLVSHDVCAGGRENGVVLSGWDIRSVCTGREDGHLLVLGGSADKRAHLLRCDPRIGTFCRSCPSISILAQALSPKFLCRLLQVITGMMWWLPVATWWRCRTTYRSACPPGTCVYGSVSTRWTGDP